MKKSLMIILIGLFGLSMPMKSLAANQWVTVELNNATFLIKGNAKYLEAFEQAYEQSEETAINFLLDSKWSFGRKCSITDVQSDGSRFTARGAGVRMITKFWLEWREQVGQEAVDNLK
ncbi:hypothetical protein [Marinoscillum sp.]|uniref:hypothetical protein n=1 Tax=Marinoscillum sp. TaxID=2024838 RepID=UPI003BADBDA0